MRVCPRCPPPLEFLTEDERVLEIELVMESALANGLDPLAIAVVHFLGRHALSREQYAALALARLLMRLKRGVALYEAMPAKLRSG